MRKRCLAGVMAAAVTGLIVCGGLTACGGVSGGENTGSQEAVSGQAAVSRDGAEDSVSASPAAEAGEIRPQYRDAYEYDMAGIDFFCEVMGVGKDKITLNYNFTDEMGLNCFDIGIEGEPERSGTYIIDEYTDDWERLYRRVNKQLSSKELDDRGIHMPSKDTALIYETIYDSAWLTDAEDFLPKNRRLMIPM